jgi:hypothetical protein
LLPQKVPVRPGMSRQSRQTARGSTIDGNYRRM